jgi:PAS domain S-box-containing protein
MVKRRSTLLNKSDRSVSPIAHLKDDLDNPLAQAEGRFRLFMESVKDYAIVLMDPDGRVIDCNAGAELILGYGPEMLGQTFAIFFPDDDRRAGVPERELRKSAETGQVSDDRWHVRKDGSYFWAFGITNAMRDERGTLRGFAKILRDSSERKRLEDELRDKNEALQNADRLKDEFLAMLAHELRNPLAPIFNALSILRRERTLSEVGQQARSIIERQARGLSDLVDDLLDVSRVTTGKIQLNKAIVDFRDIINAAVQANRSHLEARKHSLTLSLPRKPLWLNADRTRIEQVVTNLLSNASKYSDEGSRIEVTAAKEGHFAVLRVRDWGIGIPPDFLPRVFDLFAQGDWSLTRSQGGLGVGLTLVRKLVEMHGGDAEATSKGLGEGSEFIVSLPIREETLQSSAGDKTFHAPKPVAKPLRLLVVDDNVDAAESLSMMLSLSGHDVKTIVSPTTVLDAARQHRPDVVFLDIKMPGISGYQLALQLRQIEELANTVLVATTGYGQEDARELGTQVGFSHYLIKPIDPQTVEQVLASIAEARR